MKGEKRRKVLIGVGALMVGALLAGCPPKKEGKGDTFQRGKP